VALLELEALVVGDSFVSEVTVAPFKESNGKPNETHAAVANKNSSRYLCLTNLNVNGLWMLLEIPGTILCGTFSTGHEKQQLAFDTERRRSSQTIDRKAYPRRGLAQIASDRRE
jgi:hypothetical protein